MTSLSLSLPVSTRSVYKCFSHPLLAKKQQNRSGELPSTHAFGQNFQLPSFLNSKVAQENGKTSISQIFTGKSVSMFHQNPIATDFVLPH